MEEIAMEDVLRPIYQERASNSNTLGVLLIEKNKPISPETDNFDVILLIIVTDSTQAWFVKHYECNEQTVAMHVVDEKLLNEWIDTGSYRRAIEWVINGKTLFDRNEYVETLKQQISNFPIDKRNLKLAIEFSKLTRSYSESKDLYKSGHFLDAYSRVLRSLHYLGRIAIIEKGYHPELVVWNQVKRIDPEVYKLYEELINSEEEPKKRVELILLAIEFALGSRAKNCSSHLLEIMKRSDEPWSYGELKVHPKVAPYTLDLSAMIEYLTEKGIIRVILDNTKGQDVYHRKYEV